MQDVAADFQQGLDDVDIDDLLDRPPCMDDEKAVFVDPLTQCPQKPRGRKKGNGKKKANEPQPEPAAASKTSTRKPRGTKREAAEPGEQIEKPKTKRARGKSNNAEASAVGTGRPSAAACGFSTAGLTDAEVTERINATATSPAPSVAPKASKKRARNGKRTTAKGSSHVDQVDKVEPIDSNTVPSVEETEGPKPKRTRRKAKSSMSDPPSADGSTSMPSTAVADMAPPTGGEDMPAPASAFADMAPPTGDEDMPAPASAVADMAPPTGGEDMPVPAAAEPTAEVATPTGADELGEPATEASAREIARAERAARQSRKSSAYHKAAARAKKQGLSKEECKAAGKAVTWIHFIM